MSPRKGASRATPTAPRVYRPCRTPVVVQSKTALPAKRKPAPSRVKSMPAAPPVYRPQPTPKVLQTKVAVGQPSRVAVQSRRPVGPPVVQSKVMQPKVAQRISNNVVQRVLNLKDPPGKVTEISGDDEIMLIGTYDASQKVIDCLRTRAESKTTFHYANWKSAVNAAVAWVDPIARMKRSNMRNQIAKAIPVEERSLYGPQKKHNYGFEHKEIAVGMVKGKFHKGRGGQPYHLTKKGDYGGAVIKSDYDSLIAVFESDPNSEQVIAAAILEQIKTGKITTAFSWETMRAISTMVQLTQFIEPHNSRAPGVDKWARASFRAIAANASTFKREFNRASGDFFPARAKSTKKKALSKFGGQEWTRAVLALPAKKSDKLTLGEDDAEGPRETLEDYLSESSDEDA